VQCPHTGGRPFCLPEEVLALWIDCDASFCDEHIDNLSGAGYGRHFLADNGDSLAERGGGNDGAACRSAGVAMTADTVKEEAVRMRHHVDIEIDIDLRGSHQSDIEHIRH